MHFATSTCNIVCLGTWHSVGKYARAHSLFILSSDDNNDLHVWDLLSFGRPKLVASAHFDQTKYDYLA